MPPPGAPRVRFAPSPTGFLHVGGARTALFNWLYARKTGGTFVLRIEDTDQARSTEAHTQVILDGLRWLGISWDEGPFFQGAEVARHQRDADRLLAAGQAYRCFCTKEDLEQQRARAPGGAETFKYDRRCLRLDQAEIDRRVAAGQPYAIRFLMPAEEIAWDDAVHGVITWHGRDLDDLVILRSNRTPIYNLAVVSDDIAMGITHVLRGDDHISNTPKQIALYRALGASVPRFGHVPMILGPDGKKLSKRHGATAVGDYQHQGILPAAMRNFLALLGWSPGDDREIMTAAELIAAFSLEAIQKKAAVFDFTKLEWMNGQYLSALPAAAIEPLIRPALASMGVDPGDRPMGPIIDAVKSRARTVTQLAERAAVRIDPTRAKVEPKGIALIEKMGPKYRENLGHAVTALSPLGSTEWTADSILAAIKGAGERLEIKLADLMQPIRVALTGDTVSEPVNELLVAVGRTTALTVLERAARG
ncbi:MAG: glutamate--tRNA ligase [Gemmatimonadetes bacterium]|nr:glutamate--tRNA ligase [Gemmatimonadota bacterium]